MSATVDNCFLRVHEEVGGIEEALHDSTSLFIIVGTSGEEYVTRDDAFLLPLIHEGIEIPSALSIQNGSISFLGWFVPPTAPPRLITLHTDSALRPGIYAIFSMRMDPDGLKSIACDIGGKVTSSAGLTSLYTEPGVGALLQSVMLAKFLTSYMHCSTCGERLAMRNSCGLAQVCKACSKEYFLPIQPHVCALVIHDNQILLTPRDGDSDLWGLPLFELEVCETPMSALLVNLYDATAVDIKQYIHSSMALDMTISSVDVSGLVTVWQVCVNRGFEPHDDRYARWFTKEQCAELLSSRGLTERSIDGFLLREWIGGTLSGHLVSAPAPFDKIGL